MSLPEGIIKLIREEQVRQGGRFIPDEQEYLQKLADKAEFVSHNSSSKFLGFVFFYCNDPEKQLSHITLLMVSPDSRKMGIGASLVKYVLEQTKQRGFKVCRLEVKKDNGGAIKLYQSVGFCEIEDRGDRYLMQAAVS